MVSRTGDADDEPDASKLFAHQISQKVLVDTDSRTVSWKSKSAKGCVTTHLPNPVALKMDGAVANDLNSPIGADAMLQ